MRLGFVPCLMLLILSAVPRCSSAAEGWYTDFDAARAAAQQQNKPLLVHFWAEWCGPCQQMEKTVLHTPEVLNELKSDIIAVRINADQRKDLLARFGIESLPSDIVLEPSGERMMESTNFRPAREYIAMIQRAKVRQIELEKARARTAPQPDTSLAQNDSSIPDGREQTRLTAEERLLPMIDGYCPVTLWENRKWIKGSTEFQSEFRGQIYHLSSAAAKATFEENPRRFTPRFLGCDPVIVWESDRAVRGTTRFGAFYDDELYLFSTIENRNKFKESPDRYIRTRIVLRPEHIETVTR